MNLQTNPTVSDAAAVYTSRQGIIACPRKCDREILGATVLTERMGRMLRLEAGDRVLDLGCGEGESASHLAEVFGAQMVGLDLDEDALGVARGRMAGNERMRGHQFLKGDAATIPFAPDSFDAIFCERSLHAFENEERCVGEMERVLKSSGCIGIVDMYVVEGYEERALPLLGFLGFALRVKTLKRTIRLFEGCGMELQTFEPCGHLLSRYLESLYMTNYVGSATCGMRTKIVETLENLWETVEVGNIGYGMMVFRKTSLL